MYKAMQLPDEQMHLNLIESPVLRRFLSCENRPAIPAVIAKDFNEMIAKELANREADKKRLEAAEKKRLEAKNLPVPVARTHKEKLADQAKDGCIYYCGKCGFLRSKLGTYEQLKSHKCGAAFVEIGIDHRKAAQKAKVAQQAAGSLLEPGQVDDEGVYYCKQCGFMSGNPGSYEHVAAKSHPCGGQFIGRT